MEINLYQMKNILLLITLFCIVQKDFAQNFDSIYYENIHSAQLAPVNYEIGVPIIKLNTKNNLVVQFDDLDDDFVDVAVGEPAHKLFRQFHHQVRVHLMIDEVVDFEDASFEAFPVA